jgi:hypothetical protein
MDTVLGYEGGVAMLRNWQGERYSYTDPPDHA